LPSRATLGAKLPAGPVNFELQTETMASMLRLCRGGAVVTTGSNPYTHTIAGGALPSATAQVLVPQANTITTEEKDALGLMVNGWTIGCQANQIATFSIDALAFDLIINQAAAAYSPSATITKLTFAHLTTTLTGTGICIDGFTLTGANALNHDPKSCATDAGRSYPREGGEQSITGELMFDFENWTVFSQQVAGTQGALVFAFNAGASAQLTITLNVILQSDATPVIEGEGIVKYKVPFEVLHATADASACTMVLINTDSAA
jgi:hypothetical protein